MSVEAAPPLALNATLRWEVARKRLPNSARSVLEVGTGLGAVGVRLAQRYPGYVGLEPDPTAWRVAHARLEQRGEVRNGSTAVLRPEERFDLVCAFEVLEHIEDDLGALRDWVGRLRPGGTLALSTPAWARRMGAHDAAVGHYRRYDPDQLSALLEAAGLRDVQVTCYGGLSGYLLEAVRNTVARLRSRDPRLSMERRTAASGRYLQPRSAAATAVLRAASSPLLLMARTTPGRGPGIVATAVRP